MYPFDVSLNVTKIDLLNDKLGKPHVRIMHELQNSFEIKISMSHSDYYGNCNGSGD